MMFCTLALLAHLTGQVTLVPVRPEYRIKLSELSRAQIELLFKNGTDGPETFIDSKFYPNHRWVLLDRDGRLVDRTGLGVEYKRGFYGNIRDHNDRHYVAPGGSYRYKLPPLGDCFIVEPGTYTLHIEYGEWQEGAQMRLKVKPIRIIVTK